MKQVAAWFTSATVVLFLGSAVAIFGFDYYEPGFGRAYTMKLASLIGLALAAIGAAAYTTTTIARRCRATVLQALVGGAMFQVLLFAAIEGTKRFAPELDSLVMAVVVAVLLGAASSLLAVRHVA